MMISRKTVNSPIGPLTLTAEDGYLTRLDFGDAGGKDDCAVLCEAQRQLDAYFLGTLRRFDLPLRPKGTPFQQAVWQALTAIPYGETRSYADIARAIGRPHACRAVGGANHVNPLAILIPCHRVIGADGSLTGYGGGLNIKEYLLKLEQEKGGNKS